MHSIGGAVVGGLAGVGSAYMEGKTEDPSNKDLAKIFGVYFGGMGLFIGFIVYTVRF